MARGAIPTRTCFKLVDGAQGTSNNRQRSNSMADICDDMDWPILVSNAATVSLIDQKYDMTELACG